MLADSVGVNRRHKGQYAEALVVDFLSARGLQVVGRNVYVHHGEVDLLLRAGSGSAALRVCEVRSRWRRGHRICEAALPHAKRKKLRRTLEQLSADGFDIMAVDLAFVSVCDSATSIDYLRNVSLCD